MKLHPLCCDRLPFHGAMKSVSVECLDDFSTVLWTIELATMVVYLFFPKNVLWSTLFDSGRLFFCCQKYLWSLIR